MLGLLVFVLGVPLSILVCYIMYKTLRLRNMLDIQGCRIQAVLDWLESAIKFWQHSVLGARCQKER
jgi:hypothetical protein